MYLHKTRIVSIIESRYMMVYYFNFKFITIGSEINTYSLQTSNFQCLKN